MELKLKIVLILFLIVICFIAYWLLHSIQKAKQSQSIRYNFNKFPCLKSLIHKTDEIEKNITIEDLISEAKKEFKLYCQSIIILNEIPVNIKQLSNLIEDEKFRQKVINSSILNEFGSKLRDANIISIILIEKFSKSTIKKYLVQLNDSFIRSKKSFGLDKIEQIIKIMNLYKIEVEQLINITGNLSFLMNNLFIDENKNIIDQIKIALITILIVLVLLTVMNKQIQILPGFMLIFIMCISLLLYNNKKDNLELKGTKKIDEINQIIHIFKNNLITILNKFSTFNCCLDNLKQIIEYNSIDNY